MGLKGAIIGFGFISSKGHLPAYLERGKKQKDVDIVAIADICPARLEAARKAIPGIRVYSTADELIQAEKGKIDFVDVSAPPYDHARIAHLAFENGMHVLCEKPLTTKVQDARALLEHAEKSRRVLFPCHNYKHAPVVKSIREIIDSGRIGKIKTVTLSTYRNTHAKGVTEWNTHWRREKRYSGGGIAMDHGSHSFYLIFDWLASYPTHVTAKMFTQNTQWDTEDFFTATMQFPTGVAQIFLTWTAGVRKVIYTLQGERGAIRVEDDDMEISTMRATSGEDVAQGNVAWDFEKKSIASHWMDASHVSWFNSLFDQFKEAVVKGEFVGREAREALLCVQLIERAYQSSQEGSLELSL